MALMIIDECTSCGLCIDECLTNAISEGDKIYVINPEKCIECAGFYNGPQCVKVCPVDAIKPDPNHRESIEELHLFSLIQGPSLFHVRLPVYYSHHGSGRGMSRGQGKGTGGGMGSGAGRGMGGGRGRGGRGVVL